MQTILLPTDFSQNSLMAVDFAVNNLMGDKSKLVLLNVFDIPHGGTSGLFYLMDELKKQATNDMAAFSTKLEERFAGKNIEFETKLSQGDFPEQCRIIAQDIKADCIVMGTKGASGVKEILIGSNTVALMRTLVCPLFVIPENYSDKAIKELIISYDGKEVSPNLAKPVSFYAQKHQIPIRFLHVRVEEEPPIQDWSELKSMFEGIECRMHESYGEDYEDGLKKGTENAEAMLVMVRHKQSFWERFFNMSDSRDAVMRAELPMMVIPE